MAIQNNGNENEKTSDAPLATDVKEADSASNGKQKRRGRAARRRRRAEARSALTGQKEGATTASSRKKDAPTPGRRQKERVNFVTRLVRPVTTYLQETIAELRKVTWPTREEALRLSGIVLTVTVVSAIVLGLYNALLDAGLGFLLSLLT